MHIAGFCFEVEMAEDLIFVRYAAHVVFDDRTLFITSAHDVTSFSSSCYMFVSYIIHINHEKVNSIRAVLPELAVISTGTDR